MSKGNGTSANHKVFQETFLDTKQKNVPAVSEAWVLELAGILK